MANAIIRSRNWISITAILTAVIMMVWIAGCSDDSPTNPLGGGEDATGTVAGSSGCQSHGGSESSALQSTEDCASFDYDGVGRLDLTHINGAFNCCYSNIVADITIGGGVISIREGETFNGGSGCTCLCLVDVYYVIEDLEPGQYTIIIDGMYLEGGDEPLSFTADLSGPTSGTHCVTRDHYPW